MISSPPRNAIVTAELAGELGRVLERFASECGCTRKNPVTIFFKPGIFGHHQVNRAADIYGVGDLGIGDWASRWNRCQQQTATSRDRRANHILLNREHMTNLGWRLYKAMQIYGRWAQPYGYPIQLFGPWTRAEGPWRHISDRLLYAHRDHIHVGK